MKTVIISRNEKELARVPLNRKILLAGRSPSCDAVVRSKGIKPVQFMIEHVSENLEESPVVTDFEAGFWTLIDVSEENTVQAEKKAASSGSGIVLDTTMQNFNGFDFKVVTDSLQETDLKKGVISRSIDHTSETTGNQRDVIEVVYFRKDLDIITNISHLNRKNTSKRIKLFPQQLPDFIFEWENNSDVKATMKTEGLSEHFQIFKRGERITDDFISQKSVPIRHDDVLHIETETDDFYLRLVPEVEVALEKFSWFKDYIVRTTIGIIAIVSMLLFLLSHFTPEPIPPPEPPRMIRIEVPSAPEPPAQVVEPVETTEVAAKPKDTTPKPVEEKPTEKKPKMAVSKDKKSAAIAAEKATVTKKPEEKPRAGLNQNTKPKDVNTIGLLAKLKGGTNTGGKQKVSADTVLNQGVVSETMTGETGKVIVNKAPSGAIGRTSKSSNPNALSEASTTLSGSSATHAKASAGLAMAGGNSRFSNGTQLNGLNNGGGSGNGTTPSGGGGSAASGSGFDRGEAMQAVGGLDKDAIRKALRENRRAIANCYETALLTKKQLDGRMTFRWVISVEGSVSSIKLQSSELAMPNFESCVESVIKQIRFPQAPNKMTTTVIYPFAFQGKK